MAISSDFLIFIFSRNVGLHWLLIVFIFVYFQVYYLLADLL